MKKKPIVIAHRGACGYLPENTIPGMALAFGMGCDYVEMDALLTRDDHAIVFHDHYLDAMTDVAERFPERKRKDGRFYAVDLTLKEIRELRLHDRTDITTGKAAYPGRFPVDAVISFRIPTLEEVIGLVQGLNTSMKKDAGMFIEAKGPAFHRQEGKKIEDIVIATLALYGYTGRESRCVVQSFEPDSIRYMRNTLKSNLPMIQLIGDASWEETPGVDYNRLLTREGLAEVAGYADYIGPWTNQIVSDGDKGLEPVHAPFVGWAQEKGLKVVPYTFRADALPKYVKSYDEMLELFIGRIGVDGIFTDFPDKAVAFLGRK